MFMWPGLAFEKISVDNISHYFPPGLHVDVLRLDKLSPTISGNKWFKLRYYLDEAITSGKGILTFGGAWSNHIVATAAACHAADLPSIGIIRGEEPAAFSTTLQQAKASGMQLHFVSRSDYRSKIIPSHLTVTNYVIVPEGGYGINGARGAATLLDHCEKSYTHYCCAVGTGTMLAGIASRLTTGEQAIGISVLKNNLQLNSAIDTLLTHHADYLLYHDYSFGGYAKHTPELLSFMNSFFQATGIELDFVYTGKLFYAITDLAGKQFFPGGSRLLIVHSGGLQGNRSLPGGALAY